MLRFVAVSVLFAVPTLGHAEDLGQLMTVCAPNVHVSTMSGIVRAESGGNPFALLDNDKVGKPRGQRVLRSFRPQTREEAIALATELVRAGHSVDMGLGQINSQNLKWLEMRIEDLFDPCKNLNGAEQVLLGFYERAARLAGEGGKALSMALSAYNTGNFKDGITNGYVAKVRGAAKSGIPALRVAPPFAGGARHVVVRASQTLGRGVLAMKPTLLEAKLASIDVEAF
jgi:type IV secretion system protein VirB1